MVRIPLSADLNLVSSPHMRNLIEKIKRMLRIVRVTFIRKIIHLTRKVVLPGFEGVSLWEILFFFVYSIRRGFLTTRASSVAFHFFLAMIPFGLVMVILGAYIPYFDLEEDVLPVFGSFIPESIFSQFTSNLDRFQNSTVTSLVSYGFVLALYFSSNGFSQLISSFNKSKSGFKKRSWWSVKITSLLFVFAIIIGVFVLVIIALIAMKLLNFWGDYIPFIERNGDLIFSIFNALFVAAMLYFAIAMIYYFAPSNRKGFRFFSAGSTLATILIIIVSEFYSFYIQKFSNYDELYGSLGTIMMLLLWIYLISIMLLVGFELNARIYGAAENRRLSNLENIQKIIREEEEE